MTLLTKWPAFLQNASGNSTRGTRQRWPESRFQTPTPLLFQNFRIRVRNRVRQFVIFVNPTPVQTPATIIDLGVIYSCFYFRNDNRLLLLPKLKSDPGSGSSFSQTFDSGSERKTQNPAGVDSGYPDPVPPLVRVPQFGKHCFSSYQG